MARKAFQRTQKNTSEQPCEYAPFNLKNMTHEEAIDIVRKNYPNVGVSGSQFETALRNLIPELRESEDERIRKILIRIVKGACGKYGIRYKGDEITEEKLIAYLEKQKDHFRDDTKKVEKQDYSGLNDLERAIHRGFLSAGGKNVPVTIIKETAKECLEQMKPAEWSEEDEKMLKSVLWVLESYVSKDECGESPALTATYPTYFKEIAWLKSLRPQPHWKPSKVQMNYLSAAVIDAKRRNDESTSGFPRYHVLKEIYEELLKL